MADAPNRNSSRRRPPADRRLCEWVAEERRELLRLAARFERRAGPAPKN